MGLTIKERGKSGTKDESSRTLDSVYITGEFKQERQLRQWKGHLKIDICEIVTHVVIWHNASKDCTKVRAARAARLIFLVQPIIHCSVLW